MLMERLKRAREVRGWTQDELGDRLAPKVTRGTVSHWEAGRSRPKRDNLFQLAKILGVAVDWLNGDSEVGGPDEGAPIKRALLRRVEIALESYLQGHSLVLSPEDRWEALEAIYGWADDTAGDSSPHEPIRIESVRSFLRRYR